MSAIVAGEPAAFVIDAGSGYSWMRGDALRRWLGAHPDWRRAEGAVGLANYNMLDFAFETEGVVARLPEMAIGPLTLTQVGVLGTAPALGALDRLVGDVFWDNWQKSATRPVAGWLGGNALGNYELTIDYPRRMSYWRAQSAPDSSLATLSPGDELVAVGGLDARGAGKAEVLGALAGKPGETRLLRLRRDGRLFETSATVLDLR